MSSSEFEADSYPGICEICGEGQVFTRTHRAIRETYQCRKCRGLLRERAQASVVVACYAPAGVRTLAELVEGPSFRTLCVYEPGTTGAFRRYLRRLPMYYQSDYVPESERGLAATASPDQDLESLTYPSSFFDLVISSDILEHVRRPSAAFREIARVLKPGGRHILTVPLQHPLPPVTVARVDTSGDDDRTLLPERDHGNGKGGRSLVYTDFGGDIVEIVRQAGFDGTLRTYSASSPLASKAITVLTVKRPYQKTPRKIETKAAATKSPIPCNICGGTQFRPGPAGRLSATKKAPHCTGCGSLERHRAFRAIFDQIRGPSFKKLSCLIFNNDCSAAGGWFASTKYSIAGTPSALDVQKIALATESVDVIICNHVLSSVQRYEQALKELVRVVSKKGFAFVSFPNPHYRQVTENWGFPKPKKHMQYRIFGADIEPKLKTILPGIGIVRVVGVDAVTGAEDRAYIMSKNPNLLGHVAEQGLKLRFLHF